MTRTTAIQRICAGLLLSIWTGCWATSAEAVNTHRNAAQALAAVQAPADHSSEASPVEFVVPQAGTPGMTSDSPLRDYFSDLEDGTEQMKRRTAAFLNNIPRVPGDLRQTLNRLIGEHGAGFFPGRVLIIAVVLCIGFGAEFLFLHLTRQFRRRFMSIPKLEGFHKLGGAVLKNLPGLMGLLVFTGAVLLTFLIMPGANTPVFRLMMLLLLLPLVSYRLAAIPSRMIFSPEAPELRFLSLSDEASDYLHRRLTGFTAYVVFSLLTYAALLRLQTPQETAAFIGLLLGSAFLIWIGVSIARNRKAITHMLLRAEASQPEGPGWLRQQFAAVWQWLAYAYLFLVWLLWVHRGIVLNLPSRSAFLISLMIVPIYLVLDQAGAWLVRASIGTMRRNGSSATDDSLSPQTNPAPDRYLHLAVMGVRSAILVALLFWLLSLWGIRVPLGTAILRAVFNILVTLILAHVVWGGASRFINRKLAEATPVKMDSEGTDTDEWKTAASADRSQTLLPLLKKFLGAVIIVMVTMILLSSIGVDIGPILAGAGVAGIAIGFGAQKLVSDILSGIFFLLDDAFRIGEYIEAGKVSGMVEQITLRNVKLRHHRGMLQIIPFSELGSVTNFMRGGIIVKFDIELPYNTDIEKVRKIIKKVGQRMTEDPELGPDLISPVKSQGVRSVGNSVMTFRVKFTANPGKHFTIRREAFRRITEALAQKGIHYAHRKVIVDLPEDLKEPVEDGTAGLVSSHKKQLLQAGAAATVETLAQEQESAEEAKTSESKNIT